MKKHNIFDNIPLAIVMILLSGATSWGVVQTKVGQLEKQSDKAEKTLDEMKDFRAEQRIQIKVLDEKLEEQKTNLKEILKEIKALK